MTGLTTNNVLAAVDAMLGEAELYKAKYGWAKKWRIYDVCEELSIFDWWNEWLSVSQLKQMKKFLETALELGFNGYACFKVGAAGCSHGMWAHTEQSEDGYSPKGGKVLHHSFRSGDNYWDAEVDGKWMNETCDEYKDRYQFTLKEVKAFLA